MDSPVGWSTPLKEDVTGKIDFVIIHWFCVFVLAEFGRAIQISAGFQHFVPTRCHGSKSKVSSRESTQLFDVIEDVDEVPIDTPL